jgi:hypothetical protein
MGQLADVINYLTGASPGGRGRPENIKAGQESTKLAQPSATPQPSRRYEMHQQIRDLGLMDSGTGKKK